LEQWVLRTGPYAWTRGVLRPTVAISYLISCCISGSYQVDRVRESVRGRG